MIKVEKESLVIGEKKGAPTTPMLKECLPDETVDSKSPNKDHIFLLTTSKQLCEDIYVRICGTSKI